MSSPNPIYQNVEGAPFKIGAKVRVEKLSDEMGDSSFINLTGTVKYFEYVCGCGQTYPNDPMIGVDFDGENVEFWKEELTLDE